MISMILAMIVSMMRTTSAMFMIMKIKTTCSPDGSVAPGITAGSLQMLLIMFKMIKNKMIKIKMIKMIIIASPANG